MLASPTISFGHVCNILKLSKPSQSPSSLRQFYNSLMGDLRLPEALHIDISAFAGPLTVKDHSGMHIKVYICLSRVRKKVTARTDNKQMSSRL